MQKAEYRYYEISQDLPVMALSGKKMGIFICGCGRNFKKRFL